MKFRVRLLVLGILAVSSACTPTAQDNRIQGDSPAAIMGSIMMLRDRMSEEEGDEFISAVRTLKMVVTDKVRPGDTTPQFISMVRGRTPYEVVQTAKTIRASIPDIRPRR